MINLVRLYECTLFDIFLNMFYTFIALKADGITKGKSKTKF